MTRYEVIHVSTNLLIKGAMPKKHIRMQVLVNQKIFITLYSEEFIWLLKQSTENNAY